MNIVPHQIRMRHSLCICICIFKLRIMHFDLNFLQCQHRMKVLIFICELCPLEDDIYFMYLYLYFQIEDYVF